MDNFSKCSVIHCLSHKTSAFKVVEEDMTVTLGEDIPSYKHGEKVGCCGRETGKGKHYYHTRDHYQGSCSINVDKRVQSITLPQGVSSLGSKAPWTWSEMDSAQLVNGEWQVSFLWWFVTTDEAWVHHFQPEMKSELWKGSLPSKKAKTVMSAGKVLVL